MALLNGSRGPPYEQSEIQRQHRICLPTKLQDHAKYLSLASSQEFDTDDALTDCFAKHQIERSIPVESLIKCKMQDNLEFLQWTKRYWDQYFPGGDYDALARRKGSGAPTAAAPTTTARTSGAGVGAGPRRGTTPTTAARGVRPGGAPAANSAMIQENNQLKETIQGLERERDFYFSKLRDIELLLQQAIEVDPELDKDEEGLVKHIQTILYSTEVSSFFYLTI